MPIKGYEIATSEQVKHARRYLTGDENDARCDILLSAASHGEDGLDIFFNNDILSI